MKFKDKTKGGYSARCVGPVITNSNGWSVWAVTFLGKEEFFIYDSFGSVLDGDESNIFNLVPDTDPFHEHVKMQAELQREDFDARLCKLEEDQSVQQDDIDSINRELGDRLDPTIVDVEHLKDLVKAINDDIGYLYKELAEFRATASTQQSDIDDINRELSERLDPTIVDVNQLKEDVEDLEQRVDDDHITLMDQVDQLSYLRKDFESLQTEVSEFRGEQNAMFTNLIDNNQDISELKHEIGLMKKMLEQTVNVDKMGTELTTFDKLKTGLDELVEDSQRYKERRWGQCQEEMVDRPDFAVDYEARYWVRDEDGCPMLTDDYYTHSEVEEKFPDQVETIHTESYRVRGKQLTEESPVLEWKWEVRAKHDREYFTTGLYYTEEEIHKYPNMVVKRKLPETGRRRV
jgi:predicted  nucleic acid-binding Zn-ribbon protein